MRLLGVQVELYSSNFGFSNPEQNGQLNGARAEPGGRGTSEELESLRLLVISLVISSCQPWV